MIGIIGGSGVYEISNIADSIEEKTVDTEYGSVEVSILDINSKKVAFIARHQKGHKTPPHMINYKANIQALKNCGVNQIIATSAVGSMNLDMPPGTFVLVDDFLDFTVLREKTFFDDEIHHMDMSQPYCSRLRDIILSCADDNESIIDHGTYVCTEGPRFETVSEIKMFKLLGGDVVGMTGLPEVVLAREKEMCYQTICIVSNYATSISEDLLTFDEVKDIMDKKNEALLNIIKSIILNLDDDFDCFCLNALDH